MEPDDLLCSRNARSQKDGERVARCPSCSQNAHDEKDGEMAGMVSVLAEPPPATSLNAEEESN